MKKSIHHFLILTISIFSINLIHAQYGYGYGNGYGYGMNRGMSQMDQTPDKPKEIPAEETATKVLEKLKPELNLDALQEVAIKNVLIENIKSQSAIIKSESISQGDKSKEIQALNEVTDRRIKEYLNEEQKETYKSLKEKGQTNKKSKKKKSKQKND